MLVFDIETGPKPMDELRAILPEFDPDSVKVGNLKPENAAAKIEQARENYWRDAEAKAALRAATGRVLAIGYQISSGGFWVAHCGTDTTEALLLCDFWARFTAARMSNSRMVGHNIFGFDLPFLRQRSWALDVEIPPHAIERDRYWASTFIDTMTRYGCGQYGEYIKLDTLAKVLGLPGKLDGVTGADFARLFATDRPLALEYLRRDVEATYQVATKLGIL